MSKKLVIFSDIDGTIVCRRSYEPGPASKAILKCHELDIDIVLVSSKNRYEIVAIQNKLGLHSSFISENGGGLFVPRSFIPFYMGAIMIGSYWRLSWEGSISMIRLALNTSAAEAGVEIRSFSEMDEKEIASITGQTPAQAELARYREYDEPFLIIDETPEKVSAIKNRIQRRGNRYVYGGKFHHITGNFDKGDKVRLLKSLYSRAFPDVVFAAVGDAPNDLPMLKLADYPFLVREPGGGFDQAATFDRVNITRGIGPDGFAEAVEKLTNDLYADVLNS